MKLDEKYAICNGMYQVELKDDVDGVLSTTPHTHNKHMEMNEKIII